MPTMKMKLHILMAMKRMSLNELSERTGLSLQRLSLLKNDKAAGVRMTTIALLIRELDCKPNDLFEYSEEGGEEEME